MPSKQAFRTSVETLERRHNVTWSLFTRTFSSFPSHTKPRSSLSEWAPTLRVLASFHPGIRMAPRQRIAEQKRLFSYLGFSRASRLRQAEKDANASPNDSQKQAEFCSLLNNAGMSSEVIKRYESRRFAVNDAVLQEYVKALVNANVISENQYNSTLESLRGAAGYSQPQFQQQQAPHQPQQNPSGFVGQQPPNSRFAHAANAASGPWGGGSAAGFGGSSGGGLAAGTFENPIIVEQKPARITFATIISHLLRFLFGVALALVIFKLFFKKSGSGNPFESLTGPPPEDTGDVPDTRFDDVQGVDEAKEELKEVVQYLQHPEKYQALGARIPKGILLTGPPGTGKTMLARAVAGEAGVKFYSKSASEFEEMLVGLGAKRVRELFDTAKQNVSMEKLFVVVARFRMLIFLFFLIAGTFHRFH